MPGKSNKSSSIGTSHLHRHHHHRTTTSVSGYGVHNMSIVGRKLAMINTKPCSQKHSLLSSDFSTPNSEMIEEEQPQTSRNNVAIATQVINPSAIGGSLHRRRLVRPFAMDDDDESFGGRRRSSRYNWSKIGYYGISIAAVVLVMTGVVLAVGYMQSEKQRILSRTSKLAQERNATLLLMREMLDSPTHNSTSEDDPLKNVSEVTTETIHSGVEDEIDSTEEVQLIEPSTASNSYDEDSDSETRIVNSERTDEGVFDEKKNEGKQNSPQFDYPEENIGTESHPGEQSVHKLPSEVSVLPPQNFNYPGFSFDIPIYNASGKDQTSFTFQVLPPTTTTDTHPSTPANVSLSDDEAFLSQNIVDIPIVAKLQTDLFEAGSDSAESEVGIEQDEEENPKSRNKGRSDNAKTNGGENPPKVKIADRSYTPRPGSRYQEKPRPPRPPYKQSIKFQMSDANSQGGVNSHEGGDGGGPQVTIVAPPPDFKYVPPAPAPPVQERVPDIAKFNFPNPSPTAQTHIATTSGFENYKFDFTTPPAVTLPSTSVDLRFNFQNFATANGLDLKFSTSSTPVTPIPGNHIDNIDYSLFTTPSTLPAPTTVNIDPIADSEFSPQSVSGTIGSASPLGATLNLYNNDYGGAGNNYGGGSNFGEENTRLAPGTVPLDLASSYIQAGPPGKTYNTNNNYGGGTADSTPSFSYNDPTLALASLIQNNVGSSGGAGGYNAGGGGYNAGGTNQQPNYNTITQGIHLLSLLSGNIPNHLLPGLDQTASSSIINAQQQDYISKPEYQIAALTGYGGSSNAFLSSLNSPSSGGESYNPYLVNSDSRSSGSSGGGYTADLYPSKTFPDQEGSFSQNIISKLTQFGGKVKTGEESVASASSARNGKSLSSPSLLGTSSGLPSIPKLPSTVEDHGPTLDVLGIRALLNKFIESGSTMSEKQTGGNGGTISENPSRKKSSDLETAASENLQSQLKRPDLAGIIASEAAAAHPEFGRKLLLKTTSQSKRSGEDYSSSEMERAEKGLKSGFYV